MTLTSFQKSRIKFHLGYAQAIPQHVLIQVDNRLILDGLAADIELQLVGDFDPLDTSVINYAGQAVAMPQSLLGNCENAYQKLNPDNVDTSLFVDEVGTIKLRGNELRKRQEIYKYHKDLLLSLLGVPPLKTAGSLRVGYNPR